MKEISELILEDGFLYSTQHEWVKPGEEGVRIGITDYAQDQLGEIVFVELPEVGATFAKEDEFGTVESVKAVSELYMPVDGEVTAVNSALEDAPELVNRKPYTDGWIIDVRPSDPSQLETLLSKDAYLELLKGTEK